MDEEEAKNLQKQFEMQKQWQTLETFVKRHLSKDAIMRYGSVKAAHPEKAMQVISLLAQMIQAGQIPEIISDEQFKKMLINLQAQKRETKIMRR